MELKIVVFAIVYLFVNYLIGRKILSLIKNYSKKTSIKLSIIYWSIFIFLASSFGIYLYFNNYLPNIISKTLFYIGSYYEVALLYLVILFPISFLFSKFFNNMLPKLDLYIISLAIILIILPIANHLGTTSKETNYEITLNKSFANNDLKIALISDIHLGKIIGNNRLDSLVKEVNSLNPDIIIISGDLIDSYLDPVINEDMLPKLSNLRSTYGVFFSFGNHDIYTNKVEELTTLLQNQGVVVLRDQSTLINESFYLVGRNDIVSKRFNQERKDLNELLISLDSSKPIIVIDHNPNDLEESVKNNVDLQLSGHTHNGQLFPLNIIAKKAFALEYGHNKIEDTNIIVSSGYGTWGPTMRIGSQSEIVLITLKSS